MNRELLDNLKPEDLDKLTIEERSGINRLLKEINERKRKYPILDVKLLPHQQKFLEAVKARNPDWTPRWKFIVFLGWNGSWKTFTNMYLTMLMALWEDCKKYGLPYIGSASLIKIYTTTWDNIRDNLDRKYLLWTWTDKDIIKFPWYVNKQKRWEVVKSTRHDKEILKEIKLNNGSVITFWTFDQGQARLQGWEPQYTVLDELPTRFDDLIEIWRGTRNTNWQLFISATPTNYNKKIHDYLFNDKFKDVMFIEQIDSLQNKHADHTWMDWLPEEEIAIRRFGSFTPPEGLVYKEFSRNKNVIPHVSPNKLWQWTKFYWAVDFGVKHPTAFLLIAIDTDWHIYVFDMYYRSGQSMAHLASWIKDKQKEYSISLEYIIADSAGARERLELKQEGIITKKAKKKQKEGTMSNRRGWIMRINHQLATGNLIISDQCKDIIDEMETHHYMENWEDWTVRKTDDDALDALRYFIFSYLVPSEKRNLRKKRKRVARNAQKHRKY